jgi:hypothetical protein
MTDSRSRMPWLSLAAALALGVLSIDPLSAMAAEGRFQLKEAGAGRFVRLDSETGAVSVCTQKGETWSCKAVADDRAELHAEIARLKDENAALAQRLESRSGKSSALELPNEADLDRVMTLVERYFERFLALIQKLDRSRDQGV